MVIKVQCFVGKYVKKDISKAISYYKECSSFNNLAPIYKNGDGVEKNIANAIEYLNGAIKIDKNNKAALIDLSRMYFYGDGCDADIKSCN
ncbi:hypothetical protein M9Y10_041057 [Tritrichomonas musculus]|uniref:Uncharacterized protein n=1 Tax=Tritrichomonas musculus TaxID=1915356 RepID=A0ABR2K3C4_9EUKA